VHRLAHLAIAGLVAAPLRAQDLFPDRVYPVGNEPHTIAVLQLDGDALPDLVVSDARGFTRLRGLGGTFQTQPHTDIPSGWVTRVLAADLDGNGFGDVLALSGTWYGGLPSDTQVCFQARMADPAGPVGFSATNAIRGTTP
jgi:hypothetical protein